MTALKSDNDTRDRVRTLTDWFDRPISPEPAGVRRAMSAMTDEEFDDLLRLREVAWTVRHSRSGDPRVLAALRDEIRARHDRRDVFGRDHAVRNRLHGEVGRV